MTAVPPASPALKASAKNVSTEGSVSRTITLKADELTLPSSSRTGL